MKAEGVTGVVSQRSVARLLAANPGHSDPAEIVRYKARALIGRARQLGWTGPPFDMETLASVHGIRVVRDRSGAVRDAVLVPDHVAGKFIIKLGGEVPEERERYNIPHEITHTFFPDCATTVRRRGGFGDDDQMVENLCDVGAAEMLFPLETFLSDVERLGGPSFGTLMALRECYRASWEATGNRLASTADSAAAMIVVSYKLKPTQKRAPSGGASATEPKLRVDYSARSAPWAERFVPQDKSIPDNSVLYDLLAPGVTAGSPDHAVSAVEDWASLRLGHVAVGAMRLATADGTLRVLAFAAPAS
jgi:Zn-dependent peptidase ImmA (M78 family)